MKSIPCFDPSTFEKYSKLRFVLPQMSNTKALFYQEIHLFYHVFFLCTHKKCDLATLSVSTNFSPHQSDCNNLLKISTGIQVLGMGGALLWFILCTNLTFNGIINYVQSIREYKQFSKKHTWGIYKCSKTTKYQ